MNPNFFFLISILISILSLFLIFLITSNSIKNNLKKFKLNFITAVICGILIALIPYLCLLTTKSLLLEVTNLLHVLIVSLASIIFCFLCFSLMNIMGRIPMITNSKRDISKDKLAFFIVSVLGSSFLLGFTYFFMQSLSIPVLLFKEQVVISLVFLSTAIYNLARIYEHFFIDQLIIQRKLSLFKVSFLFIMFSICVNASIYIFILSLLQQINFTLAIIALVSLLTLFVSTIHYIENQLLYQQKQLEYQNKILMINEQHYRSLFENNPNAVFTVDLQWNFTAVNASVLPMTGFSLHELQQLKLKDLVTEQEITKIEMILEKVFKGDNTNFETLMKTKYETIINLKVTALPIKINNEITGAYFIAQDITEQINTQRQVKFLAYHDDLTGLFNRSGIYRNLESHIHAKTLVATILIDLDMFKDINDHLGHVAGDTLLKQVTGRLKKILIRGELLARMGGDEFLICLIAPNSRNEVLERIKNIQDLMKEPFLVQESLKEITISIGVSFYPEDGEDLNTLIKHADMAMYEVKHSGRNNVIFFSSQFEEKKLEQINMLQSLKIALKQEQFILHFQPKHSANHKKIVGVETLVRWNHPEKGFVSPDEFISLAEENGLIIPLSNWIIEKAISSFSGWILEYNVNFHLSINISPIHFLDENFIPFLFAQLQKFKLPTHMIDLEITENLAIENTEQTKEKGIQISMDDFGTGYTSLTYLSQFNLDRIKIDRSFIKELPKNKNDAAIVQSLLFVAKNLNITVTAEGVEKEEQLNALLEWGCDEIQGYYYSRPLPEDKLLKYWKETVQ